MTNASIYFEQIVGIIGGMGPEASAYFTALLTKLRGHVKNDQDHIPYLLFNNPQIPDRSKYLLFNGESPLPEIIRTGLLLKSAGATFLVVPCNTAHVFTEKLEESVGLPVLNIVDLAINHISKIYGKKIKVGLLATDGTLAGKTYEKSIQKIAPSMTLVTPSKKSQEDVMKAIYHIKKYSADEVSFRLLSDAAAELVKKGAKVIVLGCTEIPLSLTKGKSDFLRIDPMEILAKDVIQKTLNSKRVWQEFPTVESSQLSVNLY